MLALNGSDNTKMRALARSAALWGPVCGVFGVLVLVAGCPVAPTACDDATPCVDDGNFCNGTESCGADGFCASSDDACAAGQTCDEANDACAPACTTDADCDDGDACTGTATCGANGCVAGTAVVCEVDAVACEMTSVCAPADGMCEVTIGCPTGQECTDGVGCTDIVCSTGADCDDGDACTVDTCTAEVCSNVAMDCDDGLVCTDDSCDAGACVNAAVTCADGETCAEPGGCSSAVACTVDGDCDDSDLCTTDSCGADLFCAFDAVVCDDSDACTDDVCDPADGACAFTAVVCGADESCIAGTCTAVGSFTLTVDDDVITGTAADDVITGSAGTFNGADIIVGNGGDDTLTVTIVDMTGEKPTVIGINTMNITVLVDSNLPSDNFAAAKTFNVDGTGALTMTALPGGTDYAFSMGSGYNDQLDVTLAAATTSGEISLALNGTGTSAVFDFDDSAGDEDLAITVNADSTLKSDGQAAEPFGKIDDVTITGTGDLTLADFADGDLNTGVDIDATGHTGMLTLTVSDDGAGQTFDFTTGGADEILGIDAVSFLDNDTQNYSLTFDSGDTNIAVDISGIDAADSAGTLAVIFGTGVTDTLAVTLGGDGDGMGHLTAITTEFITINSTGTTANAVGNLVQADAAFVSETVTVTGDQNLTIADLSGAASYVVNASAFTGDLTITVGSAQADSITGGAGDDDLDGDASTDQLFGGGGDDTLTGGAGQDQLTGGAGDDSFRVGAAAGASVDTILDFSVTDADVVVFQLSTLNALGAVDNLVTAAGSTDVSAGDTIVMATFTGGAALDPADAANVIINGSITTTNFASAFGVGSAITLAGNTGSATDAMIFVFYDDTNDQAVVGFLLDNNSNADNSIDENDTEAFTEICRIDMASADYTTLLTRTAAFAFVAD